MLSKAISRKVDPPEAGRQAASSGSGPQAAGTFKRVDSPLQEWYQGWGQVGPDGLRVPLRANDYAGHARERQAVVRPAKARDG